MGQLTERERRSCFAETLHSPCIFSSVARSGLSRSSSTSLSFSEATCPKKLLTRYATTLNPKAGPGLQRQSAGRQPVVQAQVLVVVGIFQKKCRTTGKKALAYRGKGGQNTESGFLALRLGVVLHHLNFCNFPWFHQPKQLCYDCFH